ncbi:uncharacterized protein Gasu_52860 [Galdieria sulphuraria]|uniref:Uncharacterized protein n=1 Tax=Galdieria sulphuraria TaxID=130081 RepID=M2WTF9_GALSU|nr:uncharacterized protein Gasu_52860 [Galdieria sulphuraria]EME27185.1 hypothetical protein Gasu_52860 [Galdieria sulphuraria]|eukprot:XP_005703705.1 hypothetical protein Gasu_52860 [Galdieria sulphuraria]
MSESGGGLDGSEEEFTEFAEAKSETETPVSSTEIFFQTDEKPFSGDDFQVPEQLQSLLKVENDSLYLTKVISSLDEKERKDLFHWLMNEGNPFCQEAVTVSQPFSQVSLADDVFPSILSPSLRNHSAETEQYFAQVFQKFVQKQVLELEETPQPPDSLAIHLASILSTSDLSLHSAEAELPKEIAHIKERIAKIPLPSLYGKNVNKEYLNRAPLAEMLAAERATSRVLRDMEDFKQDSQDTEYSESDLEDIPSPRNWQLFVTSEESTGSSLPEETGKSLSSPKTKESSQKEELYDVDLN